jgi:hypothetical protein
MPTVDAARVTIPRSKRKGGLRASFISAARRSKKRPGGLLRKRKLANLRIEE